MKAPYSLFEKYLYHFYWIVEHWFGRQDELGYFGKKRNELSEKIINRIKTDGELNISPIVYLDKDTPPEIVINNYIIPRIPFVIKGFGKEWPAVKYWSPEWFAENYGDLEEPFVTPDLLGKDKYTETPIREIVAQIQKGSAKYLKLSNILHRVPELYKHLRPEDFNIYKNSFGSESSRQFFMGAKGTHTLYHCALSNVYFMQIHGTKKWTLIHEKYTPLLNPLIDRQPYFLAPPDHSDPRLESQKEFFSKIPMTEFTLEPGDFYFNPGFTWHMVENTSTSIGIGFRRNSLRTPYQNFLSSLIIMTAKYPSSFIQIFQNKKGVFFPQRWP
jgi:hypothetical protein